MKADTLFNIYQSYSLAKISALNKQNLIALYAQNEQLDKLNKELARTNRRQLRKRRKSRGRISLMKSHIKDALYSCVLLTP